MSRTEISALRTTIKNKELGIFKGDQATVSPFFFDAASANLPGDERLQVIWRSPEASFSAADGPAHSQKPKATSREDQDTEIRRLVSSIPELAPAAPFLAPEAQLSEAIEDLAGGYDPLSSDLFALGTAVDLDRKSNREKTFGIVASVSGPARNHVRLALLQTEYYAFESFEDVEFAATSMPDKEPGWYTEGCTPIEQLCFSVADERSGRFLAVRRPEGTAILRPLRRPHLIGANTPLSSMSFQSEREVSVSQIDANFVFEISAKCTGGDHQAHVAFNPWFANQLAIIDSGGKLSLFILSEASQKLERWSLETGPVIKTTENLSDDGREVKFDEWAKCLWAVDEKTLVTATRKTLKMLVIEQDSLVALKVSEAVNDPESQWILDIKRSEAEPRFFFVLTSSRVIWLRALDEVERKQSRDNQVGARKVVSFCHYQSLADRSLLLHVIDNDESMTLPQSYHRQTLIDDQILSYCFTAASHLSRLASHCSPILAISIEAL